MKIKDSPAVELIAHLYGNGQEATGHSWLRLNHGLRDGLFLAVQIGLQFHEGDLDTIAKRFRGGYWFGCNFEEFYRVAVVFGNRSAWKAYEKYTNRTPFIFKPADIRQTYGGGGTGLKNPPRLVVGSEFRWNDEKVTVTSFNDEKGYMVAQSYVREESEDCETCGHQKTWPKEKILHRYTITHDDLKKAKKK